MSRPCIAEISLGALRHNYRILAQQAGSARIMSVIKANAYGHGLNIVAPALFQEGCREFAVTDATEGAYLRGIIDLDADIILLSGVFDLADTMLCNLHHLTPVVTEHWQAELLHEHDFQGNIWLKVDTGMCRLGTENLELLIQQCQQYQLHITGLMSHLACADTPDNPLNQKQMIRFTTQAPLMPDDAARSLLNSAGIASMPEYTMDVVRPGIALYGVEPVSSRKLGLRSVMTFKANIMQIRTIERGDTVSYGADFTAPKRMNIAVVSIGYADGLPRKLSNNGYATYRDDMLPIVGRICMDFCLLDTKNIPIKTGDTVTFWGNSLPAEQVARQVDTIAYELFTHLGERVRRCAVD